ncbi:MAG TPA: cobyrinate a,c-diamide synthase, partial [Pseudomonadales bacterium]|nr:cobyrinate a,c-diamide synthase [Pseudomonadales bacterium]
SPGHANMLRESLPAGMHWFGAVMQDADAELPSRHLGLLQASEIEDLEQRIDKAADALAGSFFTEEKPTLPPVVAFSPALAPDFNAALLSPRPLAGRRIAVAYDQAFAFIYHANLDLLRDLGANLVFFSPLNDAQMPEADGLYLPGGYPELHLDALAENKTMHLSILRHYESNNPIVAECGGMLYLLEKLTDQKGRTAHMVGLLQGEARMQERLSNLGLHEMALPDGTVRGHTFHHSVIRSDEIPFTHTKGVYGMPESVFRKGRLHASYLHLYFPSNPVLIASLFA